MFQAHQHMTQRIWPFIKGLAVKRQSHCRAIDARKGTLGEIEEIGKENLE
jgi:hypothetical protein